MKVFQLVVILITAVMLSASAVLYCYSFYYLVDIVERDAQVVIADYGGIDTSTDRLSFGAAYPGDSSHRQFYVRNIYGMPVRVRIGMTGELSLWVDLSETDIILQPGESQEVVAVANIPPDAEFVTVSGTLRIVFTRA